MAYPRLASPSLCSHIRRCTPRLLSSRNCAVSSNIRRYSNNTTTTTPPLVTLDPTSHPNITYLTIRNPKTRNALSLPVLESLRDTLLAVNGLESIDDIPRDIDSVVRLVNNQSKSHPSTKVLIIRTEGPVFSSGHNLREILYNNQDQPNAQTKSDVESLFKTCSSVMLLLSQIPQITFTQVHGLATAAGCQLVASSDLAIASPNAAFAVPGINIGLFCSTPAIPLSKSIPHKKAMRMLTTGETISAKDAYEWGLISHLATQHESLQTETMSIAESIASKSAKVLAMGKFGYWKHARSHRDMVDNYAFAEQLMVRNLGEEDCIYGVESFLKKQTPKWN